MSKRLFIGVYPTGIVYADREREKDGDYLTLARMPFKSLVLEWQKGVRVPPDLRKEIEKDALELAAKRGQSFKVDMAGHTVKLGG